MILQTAVAGAVWLLIKNVQHANNIPSKVFQPSLVLVTEYRLQHDMQREREMKTLFFRSSQFNQKI